MKNTHPVVCFGEVLWDILPSGTQPGGAPMNVAYHLQQLQKDPAIITRVGNDPEGKELLELFAARNITTANVHVDEIHETGKVYATRDAKGDMRYDIVQPSAWDFIEWQETFLPLLSAAEYFVYGSLAARSTVSRNTLFKLLEAAPQKVLDINLRAPHFEKGRLLDLMHYADILKMNEDELAFIAPWFCTASDLETQVRVICEKLELPVVFITRGSLGAVLYMNEQFFSHPGYPVEVADTVGSGDAFLAAALSGLIDKKPPVDIIGQAVRLGSFIATQKGGMPDYDTSMVNDFFR